MNPRWRRSRGIALVGALSAAVVIAGCSSSSTTPKTSTQPTTGGTTAPADTSDIVLGGVLTKTPFPFGVDIEKVMNEVFKETNAAGGINGRHIKWVVGDDAGDPGKSGAVARQAVGAGAVAMVGSASFVDCGTNRQYYSDQKILSIEAVGVDPFCFSSPGIASVTLSPYTQLTVQMYYASEVLKDSKLCFFQPATPGSKEAIETAVKNWETITGKKLLIDDHTIPMNETSFSTHLLLAKSKGCDAIIYGGGDTVAGPMLKQAKDQGMNDVDFMFVSVSYTEALAASSGKLGMNVYATTGVLPYTEASSDLAEFSAVAQKAGVKASVFALAGYTAAKWIIDALQHVKGPITRESVTALLKSNDYKFTTPTVPVPLVFGSADSHDRSSGVTVVQLKDGKWTTDQVVNLPGSKS